MSSKGIVARISRIVESKNVKNVIKVLIPEMIVVPHSENKIKLNNTSVTNINVYIIVIVIINITVTMYIETRFDGKLITGHLFFFLLKTSQVIFIQRGRQEPLQIGHLIKTN